MRHLWILVVGLGLGTTLRAEEELFTNVYVVPPTFLTIEHPSTPGWKPAKTPEERDKQPVRPTAKVKLEEAGISFPEGTSAVYNSATSQLIVRNTQDQMELVEAYIESIIPKVEYQIYLSVRELRFQGELSEFLKDAKGWRPSEGASELDQLIAGLFEFPALSSHHHGDSRSFVFDSYDSFREELARPPKSSTEIASERKIRRTGTLSERQFQELIRRLSQMKGIDFLSLPSVMARSQQPAFLTSGVCRIGIIPVLGEEEIINLDLFIPERGKALFEPGETSLNPTIRTRVRDSEFVVVAEKNSEGENRLIFIQGQLMDPAGMPVPPKAAKVPEKFQEAPVELPTKSGPADLIPEERSGRRSASRHRRPR